MGELGTLASAADDAMGEDEAEEYPYGYRSWSDPSCDEDAMGRSYGSSTSEAVRLFLRNLSGSERDVGDGEDNIRGVRNDIAGRWRQEASDKCSRVHQQEERVCVRVFVGHATRVPLLRAELRARVGDVLHIFDRQVRPDYSPGIAISIPLSWAKVPFHLKSTQDASLSGDSQFQGGFHPLSLLTVINLPIVQPYDATCEGSGGITEVLH